MPLGPTSKIMNKKSLKWVNVIKSPRNIILAYQEKVVLMRPCCCDGLSATNPQTVSKKIVKSSILHLFYYVKNMLLVYNIIKEPIIKPLKNFIKTSENWCKTVRKESIY